jgi:hypothetical protein
MSRSEGIEVETRKGKMERSERAKQFMPFDALAGLQEALREKEKEAEEERETDEGQSEED